MLTFFQNQLLSKILLRTLSECPDFGKTVCNDYQQITKVTTSKERVKTLVTKLHPLKNISDAFQDNNN